MEAAQHFLSAALHALGGVVLGIQLFFGSTFVATTTPSAPFSAPEHVAASSSIAISVHTIAATSSTPVVIHKTHSSTQSSSLPSIPAQQSYATPSTPSPAPVAQTETGDEVNTDTRAALVNILCTTQEGGYFEPISGSGIMVASNGVVLTNAHVGQYFLLHNYPTQNNVSCVLRTGSPAQPKYTAELLYLSPLWIAANANQITATHGMGTGENDYAFLLITGTTDGSQLPQTFSTIPMTLDEPSDGDTVFLAGYPAGFLDGQTIQTDLYATSAFTTVQALYTFSTTTADHVDLVSVGGTVLSQSGASGGSVVRPQDGALEAIIATATEGTTTAQRDLRAITLSHIDRSLRTQTNGGIADLLTGDLAQKAQDFNATIAPTLTQDLTDVLNKE